MSVTRVLLISPVPDRDPPSGDVTYTRQLLASPPPGVEYTTYDQALDDGTLVEVGSRSAVSTTQGLARVGQLLVAAARKAEHVVRRSGLTYREPVRVFRVQNDAFDLVHVHVFSHLFLGTRPPVLASAGGPLRWVYGDAWGWSDRRLRIADAVDTLIGAAWNATLCGRRLGQANLFVAPSTYLQRWLLARGWNPSDIVVQPNYLVPPPGGSASPRSAHTPTLGFVARDFDAKGGHTVLETFARLRDSIPDLRLLVAGSPPPADAPTAGITWMGEVSREELLQDVLPQVDVLVYPSHFDTGVPYSAMEALSLGIPAVVSDYRSLPDLVGDDAGTVCPAGDVDAFVASMLRLLEDADQWDSASTAAAQRFNERFSARSQAPRLRTIYDLALRRKSVSDRRRRRWVT
ncbi:glycosyltransferase family 4 protein [Ornithinimicrobium avium]|uniref:glycosyltransferase family 4 protein n=1 Tax=Ornithinimicrobium avium TaxID=2283195 RepID=UPI0013B3E5BF|nr:glycosyltransferase family 4 protein [Ornithinimicrobium avium]